MKKPTYKELANYLGVIEQTVKQYPKIKRELMVLGLMKKKELEAQALDSSLITS